MKDIVHHSSSVANFQATRLNSTNRSRSNDCNTFFFGQQNQFPSHVFRNTFRNNCYCTDLQNKIDQSTVITNITLKLHLTLHLSELYANNKLHLYYILVYEFVCNSQYKAHVNIVEYQ